jgi:hypothetical protein
VGDGIGVEVDFGVGCEVGVKVGGGTSLEKPPFGVGGGKGGEGRRTSRAHSTPASNTKSARAALRMSCNWGPILGVLVSSADAIGSPLFS